MKTKDSIQTGTSLSHDIEPVTNIFLRGVPTNLKNAFKAWCQLRGTTMKEKITAYMRNTIQGKP